MKTWIIPLLLLLAASAAAQPAGRAEIKLGASDVASITYDGVEVLFTGRPQFVVRRIEFAKPDGTTEKADVKAPAVTADAAAGRLTMKYAWGSVACTAKASAPNQVRLAVTVANDSAQSMTAAEIQLLWFKFPQRPKGHPFDQKDGWRLGGDGKDAIPTVTFDYGSAWMVACSENGGRPLGFYVQIMPWESPNRDNSVSNLTMTTAPFNCAEEDTILPPRKAQTFEFSLRFGPAGTPPSGALADLFGRFGQSNPPLLKWTDRRPIGMLMHANSNTKYPKNPRGWFNDKDLDAVSEEGRAKFRERILAAADQSVKVLKDMDAQGMVLWDVEGEEFPHATTYIGDPRMLPKLAPEMDAVADDYFKRYRDAGLKTGICIRPSRVVLEEGKARHLHNGADTAFDEAKELIEKVALAKKRWACTLFYMDTNIHFYKARDGKVTNRLLDAEVIRKILQAHPDVLIIPEFAPLGYFAVGSSYRELRGGTAATAPEVPLAYPNAFSMIVVNDGPMDARWADLVAGVRRGDILMTRGWFSDPANEKVKAIYAEAKKK
jgi:hypothetical protein